MALKELQSLLKNGFANLHYKRNLIENEIGFFETTPLDDSLWISVRLKESGVSLISILQEEYTNAIPSSTPKMRTSFYDQKVHSFLPHKKTLNYHIMNNRSTTT
jgi:hypothetical protein